MTLMGETSFDLHHLHDEKRGKTLDIPLFQISPKNVKASLLTRRRGDFAGSGNLSPSNVLQSNISGNNLNLSDQVKPVSINLSEHRMSSYTNASMAIRQMEMFPNTPTASMSPRYITTFHESVAFLRPSQTLERYERERDYSNSVTSPASKSSNTRSCSDDSFSDDMESFNYSDYTCDHRSRCECEDDTSDRMSCVASLVQRKTLVDPYFRALFIMSKFVNCNSCQKPFAVVVGREDEATFDVFPYPIAIM